MMSMLKRHLLELDQSCLKQEVEAFSILQPHEGTMQVKSEEPGINL